MCIYLTVSYVKTENNSFGFILLAGIHEREQKEINTIQAAMNDPLAGLLCRTNFEVAMKKQLQFNPQRDHDDGSFTFISIDIDDFRSINDNMGYEYRNTVLQ